MLNRLKLVLMHCIGLLILLGAMNQCLESEVIPPQTTNLRATLLQQLFDLDMARLHQRDYPYLDSLDAGYDEDNRQYYLDRGVAGSLSPAESYLCMIDYQTAESTEIRIFSPDRNASAWLRCRLRKCGKRLYTRVVFQPTGVCSDLLAIEPRLTGHLPQLAMLETD